MNIIRLCNKVLTFFGLLILILGGCNNPRKEKSAKFINPPGWLVTKINYSGGFWRCRSFLDKNHIWAYRDSTIKIIDTSGQFINSDSTSQLINAHFIESEGNGKFRIYKNGKYYIAKYKESKLEVSPFIVAPEKKDKNQSDGYDFLDWGSAWGVGIDSLSIVVYRKKNGIPICLIEGYKDFVVPISISQSSTNSNDIIVPIPDKSKFWLSFTHSNLYLIDVQSVIKESSGISNYHPKEISIPYPDYELRPFSNSRAIIFPETTWDSRRDSFSSKLTNQNAVIADIDKGTISNIQALFGYLVLNIVPLDTCSYIAQVARSKDEELVYISCDGAFHKLGKCQDLGIDISHPFDQHGEKINYKVFSNSNHTSFVIQADDKVLFFSSSHLSIKLLVSHKEGDVDGMVAPTLVEDNRNCIWLINYAKKILPRGIFAWNKTSGILYDSSQCLFASELKLPEIIPFGDGRHAVANTSFFSSKSKGLYFIDLKASLPTPGLLLGKSDLNKSYQLGSAVSFDPNKDELHLAFKNEKLSGSLDSGTVFQVQITDQKTGNIRKWITPFITPKQDNYLLNVCNS
jgi:hypothetical protein